jgi:hypothetical protein
MNNLIAILLIAIPYCLTAQSQPNRKVAETVFSYKRDGDSPFFGIKDSSLQYIYYYQNDTLISFIERYDNLITVDSILYYYKSGELTNLKQFRFSIDHLYLYGETFFNKKGKGQYRIKAVKHNVSTHLRYTPQRAWCNDSIKLIDTYHLFFNEIYQYKYALEKAKIVQKISVGANTLITILPKKPYFHYILNEYNPGLNGMFFESPIISCSFTYDVQGKILSDRFNTEHFSIYREFDYVNDKPAGLKVYYVTLEGVKSLRAERKFKYYDIVP